MENTTESHIVDASWQSRFDQTLSNFKQTLTSELSEKLGEALTRYEHLNIYAIALYHNGDYTGYLTLSLSCEEGLEEVAKSYARHGTLPLEQQQQMLRWSPCDSPLHDLSSKYNLDATEAVLAELELMIDTAYRASYEQSDIDSNTVTDWLVEIHEKVHVAINQVLQHISTLDFVAAKLEKGAVLYTTCGDTSYEDMVADIAEVNGQTKADAIYQEMLLASELSSTEYKQLLEKEARDKENPPQTNLRIKDFQALIDDFSPSFVEQDNRIYLASDNLEVYWNSPHSQNQTNRLRLMDFFEKSPHYDEIDKLYGHFIGPEFTTNDVITQVADAIARKLTETLKQQFPQRTFVVHLSLNRNSLYLIEFYEPGTDGFAPMEDLFSDEGISRYYIAGEYQPKIDIPVAFYRGNDPETPYMAFPEGLQSPNIRAKSGDIVTAPVLSSTIGYDHLAEEMEQVLMTLVSDLIIYEGISSLRQEDPEIEQWRTISLPIDPLAGRDCIIIG